MSECKHTPGPWEMSGQLIVTSGCHPHPNPKAQHTPKTVGEVHWSYDGDYGAKEPRISWPEAEANARLMIAAPALLEACQAAFDAIMKHCAETGDVIWIDPPHQLAFVHESVCERLRNVISDATGEPIAEV